MIAAALVLHLVLLVPTAVAYPPAPDHTFYGMVRNEWGEPLDVSGARVFLSTTNAAGAQAPIAVSTQPGTNYRLMVPMDSARSTKIDFTSAASLRQSQPFRLKVQIGQITYLPVEMVMTHSIGEPAGNSRLDLTLGVDSDGDGLPDAWENANGLNPNDPRDAERDSDGDGLTNREEYVAGTYAFDPNDGFRLTLVGSTGGNSTLEFFAARGRTYRVQASPDLRQWAPVNFRVVDGGGAGGLVPSYAADNYRNLRIEVPVQDGVGHRYFRAMVQ